MRQASKYDTYWSRDIIWIPKIHSQKIHPHLHPAAYNVIVSKRQLPPFLSALCPPARPSPLPASRMAFPRCFSTSSFLFHWLQRRTLKPLRDSRVTDKGSLDAWVSTWSKGTHLQRCLPGELKINTWACVRYISGWVCYRSNAALSNLIEFYIPPFCKPCSAHYNKVNKEIDLCHLILITTTWGSYLLLSFLHEKTMAQRGKLTCPG